MGLDADIVIVGAGVAGAATAYHLARLDCGHIVVLEQEEVAGAHSSGRNAAIVREHADGADCQALVSAGAEIVRRGELAPYERRGLIVVGMGQQAAGDYFPRASGKGQWCPNDGTIDVAALLQAYLDGRDVRCNTRLLEWSPGADRLRLQTSQGEIVCNRLVNAAGPWAGVVGDLPLTPMNRHLFVTTPLDWVDPGWPCVWDGTHGLYFRPESGGLLLSCCDEVPAEPGDYREDPDMLDELAEKVGRLQPGLGELSISSQWVGQRIFAADRRFVIGVDPRNDRVFHVAGLGGHGVTASFAVGRLAARLIVERGGHEVQAFAPARLLKQGRAAGSLSAGR